MCAQWGHLACVPTPSLHRVILVLSSGGRWASHTSKAPDLHTLSLGSQLPDSEAWGKGCWPLIKGPTEGPHTAGDRQSECPQPSKPSA